MDSEDPLFILYTSGSTGKPKGVLHTQAGYLLHAMVSHRYVFDLREDDIYCCAADVGWITGHSYIVYGPLGNGATTRHVRIDPDVPGRRTVLGHGGPARYQRPLHGADSHPRDRARGRRVRKTPQPRPRYGCWVAVGEPINPEAWRWYYNVVGEGRCSVVDTYWQTETGGHMITGLAGATDMKPGSGSLPFFGVQPVVVDEAGNELEGNDVTGRLCMKASWPGMMRTVYGDHDRFIQTYLAAYPGLYFTGDGCHRDQDGYYWITGRVDDVLNVAGHRLGTAEIEGALVGHPACAEAAVVGYPHDVKGTGHLRVRAAERRVHGFARTREIAARRGAQGHQPDRHAGQDPVRRGPAEDALRQDHAAHPAQDRRGRTGERRRRDDAGRPGVVRDIIEGAARAE